ncbi:conjugal transfer protein TraD [Paremcibacter congregatus]|uniref:conjugal transfer protein TraD n=1 Tax=Paremcibacter congregatus TaxID=2043170 RepID=UPI003A90B23F
MDAAQKRERHQQSRLAKERSLKAAARKKENARKFQLGGMVVKVGLHRLSDDQILGALLDQKRRLQEEEDEILVMWEELCQSTFLAPERIPVIIKFPDKPPEEITKTIKAHGLRWNRITKQWEGMILDDLLLELSTLVGADNLTVVSHD